MSVRRQYGFSLIEIMIAVAILAIISAIAIPLYQGYIAEARIRYDDQGYPSDRTDFERSFPRQRPTGLARRRRHHHDRSMGE